jgi:hypothetical protein
LQAAFCESFRHDFTLLISLSAVISGASMVTIRPTRWQHNARNQQPWHSAKNLLTRHGKAKAMQVIESLEAW